MTVKDSQVKYWDHYYDQSVSRLVPSQFAAFVLSEFSKSDCFVDFGCGNGRDSFFFSQYAEKVLAVDRSTTAIVKNTEAAVARGCTNITFDNLDLADVSECEAFVQRYEGQLSNGLMYGRFLLHAIPQESENNLLSIIRSSIGPDGKACFEFRTDRDEYQRKETEPHYRRYISSLAFSNNVRDAGFNIEYFSEGFGYAKMRKDDAHVARFILSKR